MMLLPSGAKIDAYPRTNAQFFDELQEKIAATEGPEDRVTIHTMSLEPGEPRARGVLDELAGAALRGVNTTFVTDAYTMLYPHRFAATMAFQPIPIDKPALYRREAALEELRLSNVRVGIVNTPEKELFTNTARGRSHMKISVINDQILLGGPNFHDTERTDMSVGFTHEKAADWLHQMVGDLARSSTTRAVLGDTDIEYAIDEDTRILIDVGEPGQSIIMDEALDIIDGAEQRIIVGSPFLPSGVVAQHLRSADKRGVDIHAVYDHPKNQGALALVHYCTRALYQVRSSKNTLIRPSPLGSPALHAKLIANEKSGMLTSNNFTPLTVRMGMTEIGFVRHSHEFAESISDLLLQSTNDDSRT